MARSKQPPPPKSATLDAGQLAAAIAQLDRRIDDLNKFDVRQVTERWSSEAEALENKVNTTLAGIFGADSSEYSQYQIYNLDMGPVIIGTTPSLAEVHENLRKGVKRAVGRLTALREVLQERVADSAVGAPPTIAHPKAVREASRKVFVVHGHDDGLKETVARLLQALNLHPVILHEQPNQGRTIIEKFEAHAEVDFAVVLFTGDDEGYRRGHASEAKPRARQNVILELGFFMAKLGRGKVCVLHAGSLEMPTDYAGVAYIPVDGGGAWKFMLGREISASGLQVDLNKIL